MLSLQLLIFVNTDQHFLQEDKRSGSTKLTVGGTYLEKEYIWGMCSPEDPLFIPLPEGPISSKSLKVISQEDALVRKIGNIGLASIHLNFAQILALQPLNLEILR